MDLRTYKNKYLAIPKLIASDYEFSPLTGGLFSVRILVQALFNSSYYLELTINSNSKILQIKRINVYDFHNMTTNVRHFKGEAETTAEKLLDNIVTDTAGEKIEPLKEKYNVEIEEAKKAEAIRRSKMVPLPDEKDYPQGVLYYFLKCIEKKQCPELINAEFLIAFRKARKTAFDTDTYISNFLDALVKYDAPDSTWFCYADYVADYAIHSKNADAYIEYLRRIKEMTEENTAESFTYASQAKYKILCTLNDI